MLTKEILQKIINQLDEDELKQRGILGIFREEADVCYISANKEGLVLFALEMLKAARDIEEDTIYLDTTENWVDKNSDTIIHYIEPIAEKSIPLPEAEPHVTIVDKLMPYGCIIFLIFLILLLLLGLRVFLNFIFY